MNYEVNFDGIPGPTHNYSGLAIGNIASMENKNLVSNPKSAALQGLSKMKLLADLGVVQGVLPPQERPFLPLLRELGYEGSDIIARASKENPELFRNLCSAACMWTANAAIVTPSVDTEDGLVHITPANLSTELHRSIESQTTARILKKIFSDPLYFKHHDPLPSWFANEGAANHMVFFRDVGSSGVHLFVYGKYALGQNPVSPKHFPARETFEALQAIARRHKIFPERALFVQQSPSCIDRGVFHNDVIAASHANLLLYHEHAFVGKTIIEELEKKFQEITGTPLITVMIKDAELTVEEAVKTYFFNSQIVTTDNNEMTLLAPSECQNSQRARVLISRLINDDKTPIEDVHYVNLKESMQNGGGPACLRLRVPMQQKEIDSIKPQVLLTEKLYTRLVDWVHRHYRGKLAIGDLSDPKLYEESKQALDELTYILGIGSVYSFQK